MKIFSPLAAAALIVFGVSSSAVAASTSPALKLCLNRSSGALTARTSCRASETVMTIRRLTDKVTDLQGDFEVFRSEGAEAPTTIPAAQTINIPPSPPIVNPGLLIEEGECPSGLVFASKCENPEFPSLTASASIDADGKTVTCSWSNTAGTARVGLFFVKLICRDL